MTQPISSPWVTRSVALGALGLVVFTILPVRADEKAPLSEKDIANLIRQLGAEEFTTREQAEHALVKIGKPALEALRKTLGNTTDPEVRRRAKAIMEEIDPGGTRREELEKTRAALRKT